VKQGENMSNQQDLQNYPVMNPTFEVMEIEGTQDQATMVIEPLESGYGHTIGNALRRVLLSSLPGAAITQVQVEGIDHQFTTLEGLTESVVELILNLKQVRIKATGNQAGILRLQLKGDKEVTAAQIECEAGFEVVNPSLHLATLAKGKTLNVEMRAESGIGYSMAKDRTEGNIIGEIPVDALFSPVIKVSYQVETTRVGRRTDFDKVLLKVQTDGTVTPLDAVNQAARILARQFTQIFNPVLPEPVQEEVSLSPEEAETLRLTVEELDLPTRIANALRKGGFKTVNDLVGVPRSTIAKVKNLGEKSVDVINASLQKKSVSLGD